MVVTENNSTSTRTRLKGRGIRMKRFIGVDLHKNQFVVCFLDVDNEKKDFKTYYIRKMEEFKKDLHKDDVLAVESTTNTIFFVRQVEEYVSEN